MVSWGAYPEDRCCATLVGVSELDDMRAAINAINGTQNALRETQVEHGRTLERVADVVGVLFTGSRPCRRLSDGPG
jgi:hypothetical protein